MILPFTGPEPIRGTASSAGLDLVAHRYEGDTVYTGLRVQIPEGHFGMVVPRSSLGSKGLYLKNTVGIIDSDYRGEIILKIAGYCPSPGERIAQLIIVPFINVEPVEVTELTDTVRGEGGFGSTGG